MSEATRTFLYTLRPTRPEMLSEGPTPDEAAAVSAHVSYLMGHADEGRMHLYGRTDTSDERTLGLVVFEAADEAEARALMEADPAVREGVMRAELFPYRIAYSRGAGGAR